MEPALGHVAPLEKTDVPFPSTQQLQTAFWLGVEITIFPSVLGFCLVWTYAGLVQFLKRL